MFCFQCEQTSQMTGCTSFGVCGKDPETAALQDLLIHALKGIAVFAHCAGKQGARDHDVDVFALEGLFTTMTNVNFDPQRMKSFLKQADEIRKTAQNMCEKVCKGIDQASSYVSLSWNFSEDINELIREGERQTIEGRREKYGSDILGLQEMLTYGLKGMAAYAHHAYVLGKEDDAVYAFIHECLDCLAQEEQDLEKLLGLNLKCGEVNLKVMALLDAANTGAYGQPEPTPVRIDPVKGKCILVSGHDLRDLGDLLEQTKGRGINVYTHGEMLPCHGYPEMKKHRHLVGNFGGAWQDQREEFDQFPGAILMTTNCLQKPKETYADRLFTSSVVAWPGVRHISNRDFTPVIEAALAAEGFKEDGPGKTITVGFGHHAVLSVADQVIAAVKSGAVRHFFLIGGCDGAKSGRNYYTAFAQAVPKDCIILTLACGKNRFNKLEFGEIGGLPRLLDCGQCNDAYSAIKIAEALAGAFKCGINDLPLSFIISWYEQKAVAVLLTLLYLGIKNIRLGPV
ncbi:MAG: hydroxylamine reductase, partial [bacterium]